MRLVGRSGIWTPLVLCFLAAGFVEVSSDYVNATCTFGYVGNAMQNISGTVGFVQADPNGPTLLIGQLTGFTSNASGLHGFHIHENGNVSQMCAFTGGHYNPMGMTHGNLNAPVSHVGDLGNIQVDSNGNAQINITAYNVSLQGNYSVINRSLVVHSGQDDLGLGNSTSSNSTGNSGTKIGCCVITVGVDVTVPLASTPKPFTACGNCRSSASSVLPLASLSLSCLVMAYLFIDLMTLNLDSRVKWRS